MYSSKVFIGCATAALLHVIFLLLQDGCLVSVQCLFYSQFSSNIIRGAQTKVASRWTLMKREWRGEGTTKEKCPSKASDLENKFQKTTSRHFLSSREKLLKTTWLPSSLIPTFVKVQWCIPKLLFFFQTFTTEF